MSALLLLASTSSTPCYHVNALHMNAANPNPYEIRQSDGTVILAHLLGGEDGDAIEETDDGYAVIVGNDGSGDYQFAETDSMGDIVPSGIVVNERGRQKVARSGSNIGKHLRRSAQALGIRKQIMSRGGGTGGSGGRTGGGRVGADTDTGTGTDTGTDTGTGGGRGGGGAGRGGGGAGRGGGGARPGNNASRGGRSGRQLLLDDGTTIVDKQAHVNDYSIWTEQIEDFHRRLAVSEWTGVRKTLVIPLLFKNHKSTQTSGSRWYPTKSELELLFNHQGPVDTSNYNSAQKDPFADDYDHQIAPTGSVRDVFKITSYDQLDMQSAVMDWVELPETEAYYGNGQYGMTTVLHEAIAFALDALEAKADFDFADFDLDGDGLIDSICFLHSGYGAEWGGTTVDSANYANRIWSHKWSLWSLKIPKEDGSPSYEMGWKSLKSKIKVYNYHISPALWGHGYSGTLNKIGRVGVIAHETGHFLGIPDLYDTSASGSDPGNGIGSFGLMANSWGFDGTQLCPPIMSPHSKMQLGWLNPTVIAGDGTYTAHASYDHSTQSVYKIDHNFPSGEYLLVEHRTAKGMEYCMPGSGLVIWHVDDALVDDYHTNGWPDQAGWPSNGKHYRVAVLPADKLYDLETDTNRGDVGDIWTAGQTLGPGTAASGSTTVVTHPNTDTYQNGVVDETGITIDVLGAVTSGADAGSYEFTVTFQDTTPSSAPSAPPTPITGTPALECGSWQHKMMFNLKTSDAGSSDVTWRLVDISDGATEIQLDSGGPYDAASSASSITEQCLDIYKCYELEVLDAGNGFSSGDDADQDACFTLMWNGIKVHEHVGAVDAYDASHNIDFGHGCYNTMSGTANSEVGLPLDDPAPPLAQGNMFDLMAHRDIVVWQLDSLLDDMIQENSDGSNNTEYNYKVYTKPGSYVGSETDRQAWTLVKAQTMTAVAGIGDGNADAPSKYNDGGFFFWAVPIPAQATQAFYIVLDQPLLKYATKDVSGATVKSRGEIYKSTEDFDLRSGQYVEGGTIIEGSFAPPAQLASDGSADASDTGTGTAASLNTRVGLWNGKISYSQANIFAYHAVREDTGALREGDTEAPTTAPVGGGGGGDPIKSAMPSSSPSKSPVASPSSSPSSSPEVRATSEPTSSPVASPSSSPSSSPVVRATSEPSSSPVASPSSSPSKAPSGAPSGSPSTSPVASQGVITGSPVVRATSEPSGAPSKAPIGSTTGAPIAAPVGGGGDPTSTMPSSSPSKSPVASPSSSPSSSPVASPSSSPSSSPVVASSSSPSSSPVVVTGVITSGAPSGSPVKSAPVGTWESDWDADYVAPACRSWERRATLKLQTDDYPEEISWELVDVQYGNVVKASKSYADKAGHGPLFDRVDVCLTFRSCFKLVVHDSAGDGFHMPGAGFEVLWTGENNGPVSYDTRLLGGADQRSWAEDGVSFGGRFCYLDQGTFYSSTGDHQGNAEWHGQIFDLKAKSDIIMKAFYFRINTVRKWYGYKVYTKSGSYKGYENDPDSWTLVRPQVGIRSAGLNSNVYSKNFNRPYVPILKDTTQAFLIVMSAPLARFVDLSDTDDVVTGETVCATFPQVDVMAGQTVAQYDWPTDGSSMVTQDKFTKSCFHGTLIYGPQLVASTTDIPDFEGMEAMGVNFADMVDREPPPTAGIPLVEELPVPNSNPALEALYNSLPTQDGSGPPQSVEDPDVLAGNPPDLVPPPGMMESLLDTDGSMGGGDVGGLGFQGESPAANNMGAVRRRRG
jgi:M6 family metalloprotease-like protein